MSILATIGSEVPASKTTASKPRSFGVVFNTLLGLFQLPNCKFLFYSTLSGALH